MTKREQRKSESAPLLLPPKERSIRGGRSIIALSVLSIIVLSVFSAGCIEVEYEEYTGMLVSARWDGNRVWLGFEGRTYEFSTSRLVIENGLKALSVPCVVTIQWSGSSLMSINEVIA